MISATVRDIAIILVALEILIMNGLLVVLIWQVWRLVKMIRSEMRPVIRDSQETVGTVKGSAEFVSTSFISPLISTSSRLAGIVRTVQVIRSELKSSMGEMAPARRQTRATDTDSPQEAADPTPPAA
ncbi:MAG: hypothetical protein F4047_14510 [Caldilineaceae bacterium SB0670_bin_27]|uniref:Uncharacterized protein n=1 Tax=Caldilineaceae bacterium SB0664_bin_27 TaxID=2605260 RepID=A0A6B0YPZ0_9CHLR|nr:hypothetical protein [Caldilineaceae bacterium]MDE0337289.1 hypothetical protein [Caldilineaceae bacterium]MXY92973.1 hypothetical protein [Caldilineaceae bacterium SB0664_bin_27]MYJ79320.1 hypothetical protein [Caldilineaceae bacterium SB0670_bin_27]